MEGYLNQIGYDMFKDDKSLEKVILPDTYKIIYGAAFHNCISLKEFEFASTLVNIQNTAFRNTGLVKIDLKNVGSISNAAFADCNSLISIDWSNEKVGGIEASGICSNSLEEFKIGNGKTIRNNAVYAPNCTVTLLGDDFTFVTPSLNTPYMHLRVKNVVCSETVAAHEGVPWGASQLNGVPVQ